MPLTLGAAFSMFGAGKIGVAGRPRTVNQRITNPPLFRLSYDHHIKRAVHASNMVGPFASRNNSNLLMLCESTGMAELSSACFQQHNKLTSPKPYYCVFLTLRGPFRGGSLEGARPSAAPTTPRQSTTLSRAERARCYLNLEPLRGRQRGRGAAFSRADPGEPGRKG